MPVRSMTILQMPFRPFFLLAALLAAAAIPGWGSFWLFPQLFNQSRLMLNEGGVLFWHVHEMVFGFGGAVLSGFLFTAVKNWTGLPPLKATSLLSLVVLWLISRILYFIPLDLLTNWSTLFVTAVVSAIYWGLAVILFASYILKKKLWRNAPFIFVLMLMGALDFSSQINADSTLGLHLSYSGVWILVLAITLIGGRVIPFFTAGATNTEKKFPPPWIDFATIGVQVIAVLYTFFVDWFVANSVYGVTLLVAGILQLVRLGFWNWRVSHSNAMLWTLFVSYFCLAIGEVVLAVCHIAQFAHFGEAIHVVTIGAIGGMIISMVSRVSSGHTGRPIRASKLFVASYVMILAALVLRSVLPIMLDSAQLPSLYFGSALLWGTAWILWLSQFGLLLIRPRADGRPG